MMQCFSFDCSVQNLLNQSKVHESWFFFGSIQLFSWIFFVWIFLGKKCILMQRHQIISIETRFKKTRNWKIHKNENRNGCKRKRQRKSCNLLYILIYKWAYSKNIIMMKCVPKRLKIWAICLVLNILVAAAIAFLPLFFFFFFSLSSSSFSFSSSSSSSSSSFILHFGR